MSILQDTYPTEREIVRNDKHTNNIEKDIIKSSVIDRSRKNNDKINVDEDEATDKIDSISSVVQESHDGAVTIERPWYFEGGTRYPKPATLNKKTKKRIAKLFPSEDPLNDRITNQLMFVPPNYQEIKKQKRYKTILLYNGLGAWNVKEGTSSSSSTSYFFIIYLLFFNIFFFFLVDVSPFFSKQHTKQVAIYL